MNRDIINTQPHTEVLDAQDFTKHMSKVKYLDKEYINNKLANIRNIAHKVFFFFLWRTGCRVSEVIGVCKKDLDMQNRIVTIRWLKQRKFLYRPLPIQSELYNLLDLYTATFKADQRLFPFTRQRADQLAKKYFSCSCHTFRHSFAVNWLKSSGDLYLLSRMLGHSSVKVTETYLQIVPVDIQKELMKIDF